MSFLNQMRKQK